MFAGGKKKKTINYFLQYKAKQWLSMGCRVVSKLLNICPNENEGHR